MNITRSTLLLLALLGLPAITLACGIPPELEEQLKLKAGQAEKVSAVFEKYRPRFEAMRKQHEAGRDADRQQREALHADQRKELSALLNADQMKIVDAWEQSHRPPRPDEGNGEGGGMRGSGDRPQRPDPGQGNAWGR